MSKNPEHILEALSEFQYNGANEPFSFIVYTNKITPRIIYACRFIFNQALSTNFKLTDNADEFSKSDLFKINYSDTSFDGAFQIVPSGFLLEKGIKEFMPPVKNDNNKILLYPSTSGDCEADIFSGVFFFVSRYVEWQKYVKDNHKRFEILNSTLHKLAAVKIPVVDVWIHEFKIKLKLKFPSLKLKQRAFKYISTIDVDNVYAFKAKPFVRNVGGAIKDFLRGDFSLMANRIGTVLFNKKDPFDAYDLQIELSKKHKVPLIYFFLYKNNTKFDRTINPQHPLFKELFTKLNSQNIAYGLHPSYYSSDNSALLNEELALINKNAGKSIICSRQHYLRFNIKTTPKELMQAGIKFDFTMGFASGVGFRAGTSLPFYYYDFDTESEMDLMAVPFSAMDGAYYIYDKISLSQAKDDLIGLANQLKQVDGLFITVFHDRSFSKQLYPGWEELYTELHKGLGT